MRGRMIGRYPEDSNIIDFNQIKLLAMIEEYAKLGRADMAEAIWHALDSYMVGDIDIVFKNGMPYVLKADKTLDEKNEE